MLLGRAEPEYLLDAGAVVSTAVEQHDLASGGQLLHVAWKYHWVVWRSEGTGSATTRAILGFRCAVIALDGAAFARRIPSLEDHDDALAGCLHPLGQLHELFLEPEELGRVDLLRELGATR